MFNGPVKQFARLWPIRSFASSKHCSQQYDVIAVGGGHARDEACSVVTKTGPSMLLMAHKKSSVGEMLCNASFGDIGRGYPMRHIDTLNRLCAKIYDISGVHDKLKTSCVKSKSTNRQKSVWKPYAAFQKYS